jgi:hypothetical protein
MPTRIPRASDQSAHRAGRQADNESPNRAADTEGEGHRPLDAVARRGAPDRRPFHQQTGPASRPRQPHRLQQTAAESSRLSDNELIMRFQIASNVLSQGYEQVEKEESEFILSKHMLKLLNSFIDAADALSPRLKSQHGTDDQSFAFALATRAHCRFVVSQNIGVLNRWCEDMVAFANSKETANAQGFAPELIPMLDTADEFIKEALENLTDVRRAIALFPPGIEQAINDRKTNIGLVIMAQAMLIMRPMTVCTEACLRRVIGEQATFLAMQEKLLYSALSPLLANIESLTSDRWINQMRPVLKDAAMVCLDVAVFAIDLSLPEADAERSKEDIERARNRIDSCLQECSALVHLINEWQECYPTTGVENALGALCLSSDLQAGDFVSVLAPSGLHVPGRIQEDGRATVLSSEGLSFKQIDGDFRLVEEAYSDIELDTETATEPLSHRQSLKLAKEIAKAEKLLAEDIQRHSTLHLTTCKGLNNPDLVMPAYRLQAEKLQHQAGQMNKVAGRLVRLQSASTITDEQQGQLTSLADRLREQATHLVFKAKELTSPETRWSLIKAYARPQARQLAELLEAGQISRVHKPTRLPGTPPNRLFEAKIQTEPDADGTTHPTIWLHLHARKSMSLTAVRKGDAQHFEAVHLKSDIEKNRGPKWIEAERAKGRYDAEVHRSPVGAELLQGLKQFGNW